MNRKTTLAVGFSILALVLASCGPPPASRLRRLSLGMTQEQVVQRQALGKPNAVKGAIRNQHGEVVQVWEYKLQVSNWATDRYWLYFVDGTLVRWTDGEDKDWSEEEQRIYETRFVPE